MKCHLRVEKCIHNWKKSDNAPQVKTMLFKHFGHDTSKTSSLAFILLPLYELKLMYKPNSGERFPFSRYETRH